MRTGAGDEAQERTFGIGLVDDDPMTLVVLASIFGKRLRDQGIRVVWTAHDGDSAIDRCVCHASETNLVLVDMGMDDVDGPTVCQRIRRFSSTIVIYAITAHSLLHYAQAAAGNGAQALFDKADIATLRQAVIDCAAGQVFIGEGFPMPSDSLPPLPETSSPTHVGQALSPKETEILDLTCEGLTAREVAEALGVSESTVKTHIRHAIGKTGVRNKAQLVGWWTKERNGLERGI